MGDKIKGIVFLVSGTLLLVGSLIGALFVTNGLKQQTATASGTVYRIDYPIEFAKQLGYQKNVSFHVNIDFATAGGEHIKAYKGTITPRAEGDIVPIKFNPANAESEFNIDSPVEIYFGCWITALIGVAHLIAGLSLTGK
ncbi:MAG TPA: hypothetical protein V6C69_04325 [Trichormus sp.]